MLMRLSLLASVGLTVRAPRPDARPEAIDCRLPLPEDGVWALFWPVLADLPLDGVDVRSFGSGSRGGGCRLLTLFCRDCVVAVKVDRRGSSAPADAEGCIVLLLAFDKLLFREIPGFDRGSAVCCCPLLPFIMLVISPGPTLFLGALVGAGAMLEEAALDCGTVLCRRSLNELSFVCAVTSFTVVCCPALACRPAPNLCLKLCVLVIPGR